MEKPAWRENGELGSRTLMAWGLLAVRVKTMESPVEIRPSLPATKVICRGVSLFIW